MTSYTRNPNGRDCPPSPETPAGQPHPPADGSGCGELKNPTPPTLETPLPCPGSDPCCKCPTTPGSTPTCLEALIATQTTAILAAEQANKVKADLAKLLETTKKASQEYTRDVYEKL